MSARNSKAGKAQRRAERQAAAEAKPVSAQPQYKLTSDPTVAKAQRQAIRASNRAISKSVREALRTLADQLIIDTERTIGGQDVAGTTAFRHRDCPA